MEISIPDSKNFRINIARAYPTNIHDACMAEKYCVGNKVEMLITRIPTFNMALVHELERRGHELRDTLMYWKIHLASKSTPTDVGEIPIRLAIPIEYNDVGRVAKEAFKDYYGHYHSDKRLDREDCGNVYVNWAIEQTKYKPTFIAEDEGRIVGLATMDINDGEAEYKLGGIIPEYQGRKIYKSFLVKIIELCREKNISILTISTQIDNYAVQKVWARFGLEPYMSEYTFHKWFI